MDEAGTSENSQWEDRASLEKIDFFRHALRDVDKGEVARVLDSLFLTTGSMVSLFESLFSSYMRTKYTVGVMSCTQALELCLRYYGIGVGDEVITTPLSFVATANAIEYVGATPVFVDVENTTGNIDVNLIESVITPRTKAIIPVHLYGQMCDMVALRALADTYNLKIIEDAAHCIEGERDGYKPGMLGDAACFSFYATKNITSGEGGAITTHDEQMYKWLLKGRSHGLSSNAADRYTKKYEHYDMEFLGMKCNMTNIQAAMLLHQIERIEELWQQRKTVFSWYNQLLGDYEKPSVLAGKHAYHLYTLWLASDQRDAAIAELQARNIGVAVNFRPIHLMSYYRQKYGYSVGMFPQAEMIGSRTLCLPFYPDIEESKVERVCDTIKNFFSIKG